MAKKVTFRGTWRRRRLIRPAGRKVGLCYVLTPPLMALRHPRMPVVRPERLQARTQRFFGP